MSSMHTVLLKNEHLSLTVLPECGGQIQSIVDNRSGRNWLWKNPYLAQTIPVYGQSYVEHLDTGGWDEIFPSVQPDTAPDGTSIPDHGDLVSLPWKILQQSACELTMEATSRSLPATLQRTIRLDRAPRLTLDFMLTHHSERPLPFVYASHPLFALEPGSTITLPAGTELQVTSAVGDSPHQSGDIITWPDGFTLTADTPAHALKLFSRAGAVDRFTLSHPSGEFLELSWDATALPHLGIWLNHKAWTGCDSPPYINVGIEPTTRPADTPDWEEDNPDAPTKLSWRIEVELGTREPQV